MTKGVELLARHPGRDCRGPEAREGNVSSDHGAFHFESENRNIFDNTFAKTSSGYPLSNQPHKLLSTHGK
jgi:hypothetical protein